MWKIKLGAILTISTIALSIGGYDTLAAATYTDEFNALAPVEAEVRLPSVPIIPPIEPENPDPDPDPNTSEGSLMLRYVSNLSFGSTEFDSSNDSIVTASDDGNSNSGSSFPNMVTVQDIRGVRDGWSLTVKESKPLFPGSQMTMSQHIHAETATNLGITIPQGVILGTDALEFARGDNQADGKAGVISIGMGQVNIHIPAATEIGVYESTLIWELISGPSAP